MKNKFFRTFAVTLTAVLCLTAFSTTAFAGGADPDPVSLPEETGTPTTGGIELDTEDAEGDNDTSSTTEDTENTDTEESTGTAETMTDEEMADLLSSLLGSQVDVTVTDEGMSLSPTRASSFPIRTAAPQTRPALLSRMGAISTSVPARGQTTKHLPSFPTGRRWK